MEQDLEKKLVEINENLVEIKNKKVGLGIWRSFFNGMFASFGYVAGLIVVVVILGWFLNKIGFLPAFKEQMNEFQSFFNQAKKIMDVGESASSTKQSEQGTDAFITLPDGKQVKVQIPKQ